MKPPPNQTSTTSSRFKPKFIHDDLATENKLTKSLSPSSSEHKRFLSIQDTIQRARRFYDLDPFHQLQFAVEGLGSRDKLKPSSQHKHNLAANLRAKRLNYDPNQRDGTSSKA